ncbi:MAG: hypothetical protein OXG96_02040 [Acidobacteria bacterium]|nr:hypothetical protein [Acidobacteriota bacterium]
MLQVSVAAPCNGSGKTSLLLAILQAFPGAFSTAKFTTIYREGQFCPVGNSGCPCHRLEGSFLLCEDPDVLAQPGTDTGKLVEAGARQSYWGVARPDGYPALVDLLRRDRFRESTLLLTEGNTVLGHLAPDVLLFVVNPCLPRDWWKGDSERLLEAADLVVVNPFLPETDRTGAAQSPSVEQELAPYADKCVRGQAGLRLDRWRDRRPFEAIQALLKDSARPSGRGRGAGGP